MMGMLARHGSPPVSSNAVQTPGERRDGESPTVFCAQRRQKDQHQLLRSGVPADAIVDRGHPHHHLDRVRRRQRTREELGSAGEWMEPLEAGGSHPGRYWPPTAISVARKRDNGCSPKRRILTRNRRQQDDDTNSHFYVAGSVPTTTSP